MPSLFRENDPECRVEIELRDHVASISKRPAIEILSNLVQLLQLASDRIRFMLVLRHQQRDAVDCGANSSCRIQAWRKYEPHPARGNRFCIEACCTDHSAKTDVLGLAQHAQTVANENPVLPPQGSDVGYRRQRNEIQHPPYERIISTELAGKCE